MPSLVSLAPGSAPAALRTVFVRLAVTVALGGTDALSGRFLHVLDDMSDLLRRIDEIDRDDLYPRLNLTDSRQASNRRRALP